MKSLIKIFTAGCVALIAALQLSLLTGCNDDLPAESYYTFTGETMADYLRNNEQFSLFAKIAEKAGRMDVLGSYKLYTFFPPVDTAVVSFMKERGYWDVSGDAMASVDNIPVEYCDTLVKAHLVQNMYTISEIETLSSLMNMLDFPMAVATSEEVDEEGFTKTYVNRSSAIINALRNDSVSNAMIHPVDKVITPNTDDASNLLEAASGDFSIYYEALRRTGLLDTLDAHYLDMEYEAVKGNYEEVKYPIYSGHMNYTVKRPDRRVQGYTVFVVPDQYLYAKYGNRFRADQTMDEKIQALYDLAVEQYGSEVTGRILGLDSIIDNRENPSDPNNGKTLKEAYWNMQSLTSRHNPLNIFLSYHILDRFVANENRFINYYGTNSNMINPTDWVGTLLDYSLLKIERVFNGSNTVVTEADRIPTEYVGHYFLNHASTMAYTDDEGNKQVYNHHVDGARIIVPDKEVENFSQNCAFYYLTDFIAYNEETRNTVMNCRIRTDFLSIFPELTTNNIRMNGTPSFTGADEVTTDGKDGPASCQFLKGVNYYIPSGYLKGATYNDECIFFVMRQHLHYWNWGGDEMNLLGSSYNMTFNLPNVPPGVTYEVRIGCAPMTSRGIAQFYLDGEPQGIPMDLRKLANDVAVGGIYGNEWTQMSDEERAVNIKTMKNNGFYRAPYSFYIGPKEQAPFDPSQASTCENIQNMMRIKIGTVRVRDHTQHTMTVRSMMSSETGMAFMMDYLEMVPLSICGVGGVGEDNY